MSEETLWVNTQLKGEMIAEFEMVKKHLGIGSNVDVVRFLLREKARQITGQQTLDELWITRDGIHANAPEM